MIARLATADDQQRWDDFCTANCLSYACYFRWQDVLRSWGKVPLFFLVEDDAGKVVGCLPLIVSRGVGAYRALSTPAGKCCGPVATVPEATAALLRVADEAIAEHRVAWTWVVPDPTQPLLGDVRRTLLETGHVGVHDGADESRVPHTFRIPLSDYDTLWRDVLSVNVRNQTRKAIKKGVTVQEVSLEEFGGPYLAIQEEVWRRLGNPCPTPEDLHRRLSAMTGQVRMYLARVGANVVGGLYCFYTPRVCFLMGAISRGEYASYCVNNLTYTRSMEDACRAGLSVYDMGSTPPAATSGHHHWKTQYGGQPYALRGYRRVIRTLPFLVDRGTLRLTYPVSRRLSYGGPAARLAGPVGRILIDWMGR
jgi:hypothetical protein